MNNEPQSRSSNKKIAKNTLMLYFRQVLILFVSLYTVRVVLNVLGVEDYGIYNVVGGIVSFFSFLSGTMSAATQRFFSFALGQNDFEKLKRIFTVNWLIYGLIAVTSLVLLETVGLWFVNHQLQVPPERLESTLLIFHYSVLTFVSAILTTPFMAIIIAHEDMQIYAYVSIIETIMKLGSVFLLTYLPWDKLELYGVLTLVVSFINSGAYIAICIRKYNECQFRRFYWDKTLFKEIVGFTGWTLFGQLTSVGRNQAVTILLNQWFNPLVVAARAIAVNIATQINLFSNNFNIGLYPPIVKSYAANDKREMFSLIHRGSKITFFLIWIFALPLLLEMRTALTLWLKTPPEGAVLFTQLALVEVLINSISLPVVTAARAPGQMKTYEFSLGSIQIGIFVGSWISLMLGAPAFAVFIVAIAGNLMMFFVRLWIVRNLIGFPISSFLTHVVFPSLAVVLVSATCAILTKFLLPEGLAFSFLSGMFSMLFATMGMYMIGLNRNEQKKIRDLITSRLYKIVKVSY